MKELLKEIREKAKACGNKTKEDRARKGAYVDCILAIKKQLALCNVAWRSEQLVCCENCTHFDKKDKTCGEICVNWSAHNKAN